MARKLDKRMKKSPINNKQTELMMEFMATHPDLTKGKDFKNTPSGRVYHNENWAKLTQILNANGPPEKSKLEWQQTWTNKKASAKKKLTDQKNKQFNTGGSSPQCADTTSFEDIIFIPAGLEEAVTGIQNKTIGMIDSDNGNTSDITSRSDLLNDVEIQSSDEEEEEGIEFRKQGDSVAYDEKFQKERNRIKNDKDFFYKNQLETLNSIHIAVNRIADALKARNDFEKEKFAFEKEKWAEEKKLIMEKLKLKERVVDIEVGKLSLK